MAKAWPVLRAALGDRFHPAFGEWAVDRPTAGSGSDGFAFASALAERGELPVAAEGEWKRRRLEWRLDRSGTCRRRNRPAVAVVDGAVLVQIGGRVVGWGRPRVR